MFIQKTYLGRTSNNLITRINQHLPKTLLNKIKLCNKEKKFDNLQKINNSSVIGQHLIYNPKCFESYKVDNFKIISIACKEFHMKTLEAIYILRLKPDLCKQKKLVYSFYFNFV